jgi:hypothetical protein
MQFSQFCLIWTNNRLNEEYDLTILWIAAILKIKILLLYQMKITWIISVVESFISSPAGNVILVVLSFVIFGLLLNLFAFWIKLMRPIWQLYHFWQSWHHSWRKWLFLAEKEWKENLKWNELKWIEMIVRLRIFDLRTQSLEIT